MTDIIISFSVSFTQCRNICRIDPFFRITAFTAQISVDLHCGKDSHADHDIVAGTVASDITVDAEDQTAVVTVCDRGVPFDPLSAEAPDLSLSGEERPIGGLGIFLLREMMDDLCYAYRDGRNTLRLKKHF